MDKDLARHVASVAIKTGSHLGDLLPLLKEHMPSQEYEIYAKAIARALYGISHEINDRIFAEHLDLRQEIEAQIKKYG